MKNTMSSTHSSSEAQPSVEAGSEGARRATGDPTSTDGVRFPIVAAPDPEVAEKTPRRRFTARFKLRILQQADKCNEPGQIGALLRREGLYSSHLTVWRRQRENGQLEALKPKTRGRKVNPDRPMAKRIAQLENEIQQLKHKLKQAEIIIDVQKKISEILGIMQNPGENERNI